MNDVSTVQNQDMSTQAIMFDFSMIERMNELAKMMSISKVAVPQHFRGSPGDCLAVVMQAAQWGMNPFAVAQKTFCISGVLGYEAQLVNAVIASRAPVTGRIEYEWFGPWEKVLGKFAVKKNGEGKEYRTPNWTAQDEEGCGVRVWATFKGESEPRELELLLTQARTRNSTLWADDPRQQLAYLAVKRWSRLYCPDVILGVYTPDEIEERGTERDITAESTTVDAPSAPKTRADKARAALSDRRRDAVHVPPVTVADLSEVVASIQKAETPEEMKAAAGQCEQLAEDDKKVARDAYKKRLDALKKQAEPEARPEPKSEPQSGDIDPNDDFLRGLDAA